MLQKEFITTSQAANLLGFSKTHIIRLIKSGDIEAVLVDGQYLINKNSIGVLKNITPKEIQLVKSSSSFALREYGDIIRKLGSE